jgi:flagellar hook-length control protein FliK
MTSAITRAPAGAPHAQGFARPLKGDAPAEGFEALFAAVAGTQAPPVAPPDSGAAGKGAVQGKTGEGGSGDDAPSPQALLLAASMLLAPADAKAAVPDTAAPPANSPIAAPGHGAAFAQAPALEKSSADSTRSAAAPASQTIVPNAAFATSRPVAHALIAHKEHLVEGPITPTADPPRATRAPDVTEQAAPAESPKPVPVDAHAMSHAEATPLSPPPPASPPHAPVERTRNTLSPRALVQAAMVEVVRSPGRGRTPPPEAANADASEAARAPDAAHAGVEPSEAAPSPPSSQAARTPVPQTSIIGQAEIADAAEPLVAPTPATTPATTPARTSRAAADIARQRRFVLGTNGDSSPASADAAATPGSAFETLIALGKADGAIEGRAPGTAGTASTPPVASSGAWLANLPVSAAQAPSVAAAVATPRAFDQAAWSAALAQQIASAAVATTRETTVRMEPDGLGPIEVRVRVESQHVDVRFAIEHPVTVSMVREAMPDLQRMLAQSGLNLGGTEVAQQNAGSRGQSARSDAAPSQPGEDEPVNAAGPVESRPRVRAGLLDDFV